LISKHPSHCKAAAHSGILSLGVETSVFLAREPTIRESFFIDMNPQTGLVLRLVGPLIQIVCAAIWMRTRDLGYRFVDVRLETILMIGFGLGLGMVVAGLFLSRRPVKESPISPLDFDKSGRKHF
jgi:hypothetical protein